MKFEKTLKIVGIICVLLAGLAGIVSATTITVGGGPIAAVGGQIDVPIILDSAPSGLSFYQMTVASADPTVANIVKVTYPSWATLNSTGSLPAGSVGLVAIDLGHSTPAGAANVLLATVTLQGLKAGSTQLTVTSNSLGDPSYHESPADAVVPGTIQVSGAPVTTVTTVVTTVPTTVVTTVPTTVVTTTPTTVATTSATTVPTTTPTTTVTTQATTTVPTTVVTTQTTTVVPTEPTVVPTTVVPTIPPYTGPTGQVYISTSPQGAHIVLDGATSGAVTPIIMTVPTGSHEVILKLGGYDEMKANFEVKTNAMTTVSRRLLPGNSVIPTTPGTPVVTTISTTVPTTGVTQVTTAPTSVPTTATGGWSYKTIVPSWLKKILPFNWG
jgi:hypothetical protein